jgi:hypothetical protein
MATKPKPAKTSKTTGPMGGLNAGVVAGVNTTSTAKPTPATPKSSVPTMPPAMTAAATPEPIKYATKRIYDRNGNLVEVYSEGPQAGYSVMDGSLVIQGEAPTTGPSGDIASIMSGQGGTTTKGSEKYAGLTALLSSYGIDGIANMVDKVIADFPEADGDEILNLLRYDQRYNKPYMERFAGNAARLKNKMPLLSESDYLRQEQGYSKIFKSYGLTNLDNPNQYTKLIGSDLDIDEVTERVSLAYNRVLKAESSTRNAFYRFFPMLTNQDLVAAMLDPEEQLPALERKVQSAEIGGAALHQGLMAQLADTTATSTMYKNVQAGTVGAGTLETAGVSPSGAVTGYEKIATELPTMEKLSSIYGSTMEQYGQREAEQAQLLGLASAKRKKEALIAREEAAWQGSAGTMRGSFGSQNSF